MIIRKLQQTDLKHLINLHKQFWGDISDYDKIASKYTELSANDKYVFLCAEIDERIVGSVMGIICEELYGDCKPFMVMENLVVDKTYRKHGVGKALMNQLTNQAKELNCTQILFITETNRRDAISFYESLGFDSGSHIGFKKSLK